MKQPTKKEIIDALEMAYSILFLVDHLTPKERARRMALVKPVLDRCNKEK